MGEDRRQVGHLPAGARRLICTLPESARRELGGRPFGLYVHVPFCASRCGYCDFNTYTAGELGGHRLLATYADAAAAEIRFAAATLGDDRPRVRTVYFGGGTPTLLAVDDVARILRAVRDEFGLGPDVEITIEANPDSVSPSALERLVHVGFTRISFGMQSVRSHVLAALDRTHTPGRPERAVAEAWGAGFAHVNVDLIYGTPGERDDDWVATLDAAVGTGADHVSAYALTVEPRTRLAARVRRGRLAAPDEDVLARRYAVADERLGRAGFSWYELSNWARAVEARCRHNLLYWRNDHWWGVGPGAHSHVGGTRWCNVAHPAAYADLVHAGRSPAASVEVLDAGQRALEDLLLGIRLPAGVAAGTVDPVAAAALVEDGLLDPSAWRAGRAALAPPGRLLADHVAGRLATLRGGGARSVASPGST